MKQRKEHDPADFARMIHGLRLAAERLEAHAEKTTLNLSADDTEFLKACGIAVDVTDIPNDEGRYELDGDAASSFSFPEAAE